MDPVTIATLLVALAAPLLDLLEKGGIRRLSETTPIQRAAERSADAFPEIEGVAKTLLDWTGQANFLELLSRLRSGERMASDEDEGIARRFIETSRFDFGPETLPKAITLITEFLRLLADELLLSPKGVAFLASREEVLHARTVATVENQNEQVVSEIRSLGRAVGEIALSVETPDSKPLSEDDARISAQLDLARDLLRSGQSGSARDLLKQIEGTVAGADGIREESLFRLALNLGSADLDSGHPQEALRQYERALELRPHDASALATMAKAHLTLGNADKALELAELAVREEPRNANANGIRLLALHNLGRDQELDGLVEGLSWLTESPLGSGMLGELRLAQGRPTEAVPLLRRALASTEVRLPLVRMLLAVALVNTVTEDRTSSRDELGEETATATLREAEGFFDRAVEELQSSADRNTFLDTLASRGGVRAMLGDKEGALQDLNRVLAEDANHRLALENKARILLLLQRPAESVELLDGLPLPLSPEIALVRAMALLRLDRAEEAKEVARALWSETDPNVSQVQVGDILLTAEGDLGSAELTPHVLARLEATWPDDPLAIGARADAALRRGNSDEAVDLLARATDLASGTLARHLAYQLAGLLYDAERFTEAVATYRQVGAPDPSNPEFRNYLLVLLRAGLLGEVLGLASEARQQVGIQPGVANMEAYVLQTVGDLTKAEAILEQLSSHSPDDVDTQLDLLSVRLRLGKRDAARHVVEGIHYEDVAADPNKLLDLAEARLILDLPDALEYAFRGRRLGFDSPAVHKRYMSVFINREHAEEGLLSVTQVQTGCTVLLNRADEGIVVTILEDEDVSRARDEVGPQDDLALKLQGLEIGDRVSIGVHPSSTFEYEIVKIQSKYVYAFQQTLLNFSVWFPADEDLMRVELNENDLSPLLLLVDQRHQAAEQVMDLYRQKPVTLGAVAELMGRSVIDVWIGLVGIIDEHVFASAGTDDEAERAAIAAEATSVLVLDTVAIMTLAHLGLLENVADSFRLLIPHSVLTEIRLHSLRHFEGAIPAGSIGKVGGQYVHGELTGDDFERGRAFMHALIDDLESKAEIVPVTAALSLVPGEYEKLRTALGASSADAMLVAAESAAPLYSDDVRLRQVAFSNYQVEGVWTQPVLGHLIRTGALSRSEYLEAVLKLFVSNYRYPRVSADDIYAILESRDFDLTPEVIGFVAAALGPDYTESVLGVATELITRIWRSPFSEQRRDALVGTIVGATVLRRNGRRQVLDKLGSYLDQRFRLDPIGFQQLLQLLRAWATAHHI